MSTLDKTSPFISYILTEEEQRQGSILNSYQKQVIQNLLAQYATDKMILKYDTKDPMQSIQTEAILMGQIGVLQHLLATSAALEDFTQAAAP